jgi:hypothetical protein
MAPVVFQIALPVVIFRKCTSACQNSIGCRAKICPVPTSTFACLPPIAGNEEFLKHFTRLLLADFIVADLLGAELATIQ